MEQFVPSSLTPGFQEASMNTHGPFSMFRPVLWLAAAAFAAGFGGYLIISPVVHGG